MVVLLLKEGRTAKGIAPRASKEKGSLERGNMKVRSNCRACGCNQSTFLTASSATPC
jgi:uncharacterized protein (DUF983 family)